MTEQLQIHAVLLAAGASTRFGSENKLLAIIDGQPLVARAAGRLAQASVQRLVAVVAEGAEGEAVAAVLRDLGYEVVVNTRAAEGMGTSIACGVAAINATNAGILIMPADMPSLDVKLLNRLFDAYRAHAGEKITHPVTITGEQRNPVIWPPWARADLLKLDDARGGKGLLARYRARTQTLPADNDGAFADIDTREDWVRFTKSEPREA